MKIDEHLRTALRHAPDAELQAPPDVSARILAKARARAQAMPAPQRTRPRSRVLALLPQTGLLGLALLAGGAALWLLKPPGEPTQAPVQMARTAPLQAQTESRELVAMAPPAPVPEAAKSAAAPAPARSRRPAAPPAVAVASAASLPEPAPQLMAAAPPPVAEFKPAPAAAPVLRAPPANPVRAWLASAEGEPPPWLTALAETTEGRWTEPPLPKLSAAPLAERSALRRGLADASAPWRQLLAGERRAQLLLQGEGLLWCEASRCRFAPLSAEELRRLQALLPTLPDNPPP